MQNQVFDEANLGDHDRVLNITQLMGLSMLLGIAGGALAKAVGLGWGASLLIAWASTTVGVFAITGVILIVERLVERTRQSEHTTALIEAWDDDLMEDAQAQETASEELAKTGS